MLLPPLFLSMIFPAIHTLSPGLYMSIVLSDQGALLPSGLPSLSVLANCQAAVANMAVYSLDSEDDTTAVASAICIAEITSDQQCSCRFLVPHFSAFAVVDTTPSSNDPPPAVASAPFVAASMALAAVAAAAVLL